MSDTGDAINIAAFEQLISIFTGFGAAYNPSNTGIQLTGLSAKFTSSNGALDYLVAKRAVTDAARTDRENNFDILPGRVTQAVGYYSSTGTAPNKIEDAKEFKRKIDGRRATPVTPPDPNDPNAPTNISSAQTSYTQRVEHLDGLIQVFTNDPLYDPNEIDIKLTTLNTFSTQLHASNSLVINAETDEATARMARNDEFYHPTTGLVAIARLAKDYVKALFGASSQQYKQVKAVAFRDRKV